MKRVWFYLLIIGELSVVTLVGIRFYFRWQQQNVLGTVVANPLVKDNFIFPPDDELKYFYEHKPHAIQKFKPNWLAHEVVNTINADGLNERFDYSMAKPPDTFRIMTLGDSFTFGALVNTADNYSEKLEDLLNTKLPCSKIRKFEVINLGVEGYDLEYSLHRFKIRGQKYHPDLVLWFLNYGDFSGYQEATEEKP